jgi:Opioid growth factor receptor (OGFr) conserved region.
MNIPSIAFLRGEAPDQSGRMIADYLGFTDDKWEECHDHMQWAFPTRTVSRFNPMAPVIPADFKFGGDPIVLHNLETLLRLYLRSLGMSYDSATNTIDYTPQFIMRSFNSLLRPGDHNHLRVSRIIECFNIFNPKVADSIARWFIFEIAHKYFGSFSGRNIVFWTAAWQNVELEDYKSPTT